MVTITFVHAEINVHQTVTRSWRTYECELWSEVTTASRLGRRVDIRPHHADFVVFLGEVVLDDVPQRNHAFQLLAFADGEMAKPMAAH